MGFSFGGAALGGALGGVGGGLFGGLFGGGSFNRPGSPNLPQAPNLTAPTLPNYPGLTPEEQNILNQQQGSVTGLQQLLSQYMGQGGTQYGQDTSQAGNQEIQNYLNALQGQIAPNQMISQQKQKDWEGLKQQAGQLGIQLSGDSPESAASQSTAGNQMITDFNKRYGALEQNYNLGQQQFGLNANMARMGLANQQFGQAAGAYGQIGNQLSQLYSPYQQQQLGPWQVQTQQALSNADISNQNAMNQYSAAYGQQMANYNNQMAGYQTNMGLLGSVLGLGGQLGSAYLTRGAGTGMQQPRTPGASYIQGRNFADAGAQV